MKWVRVEGGNDAYVEDIATEAPRFGVEEGGTPGDKWRLHLRIDEPAMTREEYWAERNAEVAQACPAVAALDRPGPPGVVPFDDFTIDAEILVGRAGGGNFSTVQLAELLGIAISTVHGGVAEGTIPRPRFVASKGDPEHREGQRWTQAQAVEILAARLRKAAA